jgi:hypothetical protein
MDDSGASAARRSGRPRAAEPFWKRHAEAPVLWHRVMRAAESCSVRRAMAALEDASPEDLATACSSREWSMITPVVRAVGARGETAAHRAEPELLAYIGACVERGISLDASCPQVLAWEISSPPIVTAASYGLLRTVSALLDAGATPFVHNSDGETALHAAIEQPEALRWMLASGRFGCCAGALSACGRTAFVAALLCTPWKPKHRVSAQLLAPHTWLTDHDFREVQRLRRVGRLNILVEAEHPDKNAPANGWTLARHWTFPLSDRRAMALTHALARRGHGALPPELWRHIFRFVERGWFVPPLFGTAGQQEREVAPSSSGAATSLASNRPTFDDAHHPGSSAAAV